MPARNSFTANPHQVALTAAVVLALGALAAYANSFSVPLILDDWATILHNPSIRQIWPLWHAFVPSPNTGVGGRPVANAVFVLNYALTGDSLRGYHAFNLALHFFAALALFGVIRRTLLRPQLRGQFGADSTLLAFATAALWLLHPLQTQSVTYISQRIEVLLGLFYFLTLYGFIRAVESTAPARWFILSVASCVAGMASKEGMVTAPVMVFAYDVLFVSGAMALSWKQRWRYFSCLASCWILLAALMSGLRGRGVGFGLGMTWWSYALTECQAIVRYFSLALWPQSLVFDYGTDLGSPGAVAAITAAILLILGGVIVMGLVQARPLAFLGAWFFVTLAPTSSIVPIPMQPIAENRVYVPLAAVTAAAVMLLYSAIGRRALFFSCATVAAFGILTARRNVDYHSPISIWTDTVAKMPSSSRAHNNLGHEFLEIGRAQEAKTQFEIALRLKPDYGEARLNLAGALGQLGFDNQAVEQSRLALQIDPTNAWAHTNLGVGLSRTGDLAGAIASFEAALRLRPDLAETRGKLADALLRAGRPGDAIIQSEIALKDQPPSAQTRLVQTRFTLGCALAQTGRVVEAVAAFQEVVRVRPDYPDAYFNLGTSLFQLERIPEAIANFEIALELNPNQPNVHNNLAGALLLAGRVDEAIIHSEAALRLNPRFPEAHCNLGMALARNGHPTEAITHLEEALRLNPNFTLARESLAKLVPGPKSDGASKSRE